MSAPPPVPGADEGRHPHHFLVAATVREWFTHSAPEIRYEVVERPYGFLGILAPGWTRLILTVDTPADVAGALADASKLAGGGGIHVWVEDRTRAALLTPAIEAAGWRSGPATTHLALVGQFKRRAGPEGLVVRAVGESAIEEWARVKIQAFSDSEEDPADDVLERELALRRAELPIAAHLLAYLDDEPVAVLAHYLGADQLVFNLGTRVLFRHLGIAQAMLAHFVANGEESGCRSLMINAHEGERPLLLYRRLGFTDEVYWYRTFSPNSPGGRAAGGFQPEGSPA